jgi:hypothetical protein
MQLTSLPIQKIPSVANVDVLIIGGTSQAVSFALSAKKQGCSVYLVAPRAYLGEDICAAYRFWPEQATGNSLSQTIFSEAGKPPTPMHVKLTLEQHLIAAEIPFLLNCFSAGLLRSENGTIQGAAIANRAGHQAIQAKLVVDATLEGSVLKQAGYAALQSLQGLHTIHFTTLTEGISQVAPDTGIVDTLPGYQADDYALSANRYQLEVDFGAGSPAELARAYSSAVERCWVPNEYRHQTTLTAIPAPSDRLPNAAELSIEVGLFALTESISLTDDAQSVFSNPITAMAISESLAYEVCAQLPAAIDTELSVSCAGATPIPSGTMCTLSDGLRPGSTSDRLVKFDASKLPMLGAFDVIVAGGGTGGAPAAISSARAGAQTLVVEVTSGLGGVGTMGQIAKYCHGNRVGFTAEIDQGVNALEHDDKFKNSTECWSAAAKSEWLHKTGYEKGCIYWLNTLCVGTVVEDSRVVGLVVAGPYGYGLVKAGCVVDSTGCADIPAASGAPTAVIGKEHVAVQGTGLAGIKPGREYHNSDHSFSDDTDVVDATAFFASSKLKFKDDFDCGELVDSRERRQIIGDFSLAPVDMLFNRRFPDTICVAKSNFDSHGFTVDPVFMLVAPDMEQIWADIPFGCMLPQGLDGVLVTGLGISAHRDALPVIRMQSDVQNQGYAAGFIAAQSALSHKPVRSTDIATVQKHLIGIGGLPERVLTDEDSFPVDETTLEAAVENDWDKLSGVSLMLNEGERSRRLVAQAYATIRGQHTKQSIRYAQILAILGDAAGQEELMTEISKRGWDSGWQFQGMHQFGRNMSELDSLLVCLGTCGDASAWNCILPMIENLPASTEFSHIRAITMACEQLYARHPIAEVAPLLAKLLQRPYYRGHAHGSIKASQRALSGDINENEVRNFALRELHLARALFNCGDVDALGKTTLTDYCNDSRGHFARHARAVLANS